MKIPYIYNFFLILLGICVSYDTQYDMIVRTYMDIVKDMLCKLANPLNALYLYLGRSMINLVLQGTRI